MAATTLFGVCILVFVLGSHGFLLTGGNAQEGNITGNNFLTVQSFWEFKKQQHLEFEQQHNAIEQQHSAIEQQHRATEELRQTMDQTIAILTAQLNEKLREFEKSSVHNDTLVLLNKVVNENSELKDNISSLKIELERTHIENLALKSGLLNMTSNYETRLQIVESSEKIKAQLDVLNITRQIQLVQKKTLYLEQGQIARGQDLVAIYNSLNDLRDVFKNISTKITESETICNGKINMLNSSFLTQEADMDALHHAINGSLAHLSNKVNIMDQKVALTACSSIDQNANKDYIVKFATIKTNVGVTDPSSFISSGKFLCEHDGIYMVYVTIDAYDTGIDFYIVVNNHENVRVYEYDNRVYHQRGDVTVILNLQKGATVWIKLGGAMLVNTKNSCLTIGKIK